MKKHFYILKPIINSISSSFQNLLDPDLPLDAQIEILSKNALFQLHKDFPGLNSSEKNKIAILTALNYLNFSSLYGLLSDENIEEYFLDSPDNCIYIDHNQFGRCRTNLQLTENEIESFKSIVKNSEQKKVRKKLPLLEICIRTFWDSISNNN